MNTNSLILTVVVIMGVFGLVIYGASTGWTWKVQQQAQQQPTVPSTPSQPSASAGCSVNPSLVYTVTDALQPGTAVTTTGNYRLNGVFSGTTSPTTKGTADILLNSTNYLSVIVPNVAINCGSNQVPASMYYGASPSELIYSDNGLNILTDAAAGGAYNETAKAAGLQYNWKIQLTGTDKKSTGAMLIVIETTAPIANVSSVALTPVAGAPAAVATSVPSGYTREATNGNVAAFIVPAIVGGNVVQYNLQVIPNTGYVVTGAVYTSTFSLQPFVETDGTFNTGSEGWDSLNTAKYFATVDYDFKIV